MKIPKYKIEITKKDAYKIWQVVTSSPRGLKVPYRVLHDLYKIFGDEGNRLFRKKFGEYVVETYKIYKD
jgi:hypothetical protein